LYNIDDIILYGTHGVCRIAEISERDFTGDSLEYYVLRPIYLGKSTIFIPVNSETLTSKMWRLLSVEEIYSLVKTMPGESSIWIEDEKERYTRFREILSCGDRLELMRLIKTLYLYRKSPSCKAGKLRSTDEKFLDDAERIVFGEFAHVLNIKREQVLQFILKQLEGGEKVETHNERVPGTNA
jgi:CarD family transcriptional regulator